MNDVYDVAVVGGGVIGCSVLHELTKNGYRCILLEKNQQLLSGASSGNSGMFHTVSDASPPSKEYNFISKGQQSITETLNNLTVPFKVCGAIMIAIQDTQMKHIETMYTKALQHGVNDVKLLTKEDIQRMEPNLTKSIIGGLLIPREMVLDSCLFGVSLAHSALRKGAKIQTNSQVLSAIKLDNGKWHLKTSSGPVYSKMVINAAGLYGDQLDQMAVDSAKFMIKPRKGQFTVYNKEAGTLINHTILPVPSETSKGVLIFTSVYGNLVIGPTNEETTERENPTITPETIEQLILYGKTIIPKLKEYQNIDTYAGIRPATEHKDYQILPFLDKNWLTVGGIRSTGVTGSLGISNHVYHLVKDTFKLTPSNKATPGLDAGATSWVTNTPCYVLDGAEYNITHKLMRIGLKKTCKL